MNGDFLLAFVLMPAIVVAVGWAAALWHERSLRREFGSRPRAGATRAPDEGR